MPLKLCKECRYFDGKELCTHETATHLDPESLVVGPPSVKHYYAAAMRAGTCGTNAVHFLPKIAPTADGAPF